MVSASLAVFFMDPKKVNSTAANKAGAKKPGVRGYNPLTTQNPPGNRTVAAW